MMLMPYRIAPGIEEKTIDAHVSGSARTILEMQRAGWSLKDVRNLPTLSADEGCPFYPVDVRLVFQRRAMTA